MVDLTEAFKQLDLQKLIVTFITGGLFLLIKFFWDWVKELYAHQRKLRQQDYFYLAKKQVMQDQFTQRVLDRVGSDYIWLYRFHNGEHWEGGDSIKKMSMTSEAKRSNAFQSWVDDAQGVPLSNYPNYLLQLRDDPISTQNWTENPDFQVHVVMRRRGIATTVSLLVMGHKTPIGILVLSWCDVNLLVDRLQRDALNGFRAEATLLLTD